MLFKLTAIRPTGTKHVSWHFSEALLNLRIKLLEDQGCAYIVVSTEKV